LQLPINYLSLPLASQPSLGLGLLHNNKISNRTKFLHTIQNSFLDTSKEKIHIKFRQKWYILLNVADEICTAKAHLICFKRYRVHISAGIWLSVVIPLLQK
jgi:hypothetical protein